MLQPTFSVLGLTSPDARSGAPSAGKGWFEPGTGQGADCRNEIVIFGGTGGVVSSVDRVFAAGYAGDRATQFHVTGAPDFGPVAETQQFTSNGSVVGGVEYNFSFWAAGTPGPGSVVFCEVLWLDSDGSNGVGPQGGATGLQAFGYGDSSSQIGFSGMVAPTSADSVVIQIRPVAGAFTGASGQLTVDDVSFAAVPGPGALALLGLAAARRRRA